jgi:hypothetical protein
MRTIKLSETFAKWVIEMSRGLLKHANGRSYDPTTCSWGEQELPPCIDRIPVADHELHYLVGSMLQFLKTMAGIFSNELRQLEMFDDLPFLPLLESDDENKSPDDVMR